MAVFVALIEETVDARICRQRQMVGDEVDAQVIPHIEHVAVRLVGLRVEKLVIFRPGIFRKVAIVIDAPCPPQGID